MTKKTKSTKTKTKQTFEIPVVVHIQDCGDGSMSTTIYNNLDELWKDIEQYGELSDEEKQERLDQGTHDTGYIKQNETIEIEVINGVARLKDKLFVTSD